MYLRYAVDGVLGRAFSMFVITSRYRTFGVHKAFLMAASTMVPMVVGSPAFSADITVASGSTVGQQSVSDGDTLTIENGATVNSATPGVVDAVDGTTITIHNDGTITSTADTAIDNSGSALNLTNNGSISGAVDGVNTENIGTFINTADIVGSANGIYASGDTNQFTNTGSITGVGSFGLQGDGTLTSLTNTGLITGSFAGIYYDSIGNILNSGTISGFSVGSVGLAADVLNSVVNTGLITAPDGIGIQTSGLFGNLDNSGTISGSQAGVFAEDLGGVVNSGLITGGNGIYSNDSLVSLINTGTISGTSGICGCTLGFGVYVENTAGSIVNYGSITGIDNGIDVFDLNNLVNTGTIASSNSDGVLADGGTIGNLTNSGSITGAVHAVDARYITMLTNTGSLTGGEEGVFAQSITSLNNTGSITGTMFDGISAESLGMLINDGSITGGDDGIDVEYITNLTNNGSITGQDEGIKSREITLLTNNGTITGGNASDESGIDADFGTIVNNGLIQGGIGIEFDRNNSDGANTGNSVVTNNGTIKSFSGTSGFAIDFQKTGADTLTLGPNSILIGTVKWDGVDDTLNLNPNVSSVVKFSTAPENINNGSNFVIIDGSTIIQVDTNFFATIDDVVFATSGSIHNVVSNQLIDDVFGNSSNAPQAYNGLDANGSKSVWNSNWLSYNQLDTTNNISTDYTLSRGSVFGIENTNQFGTKIGGYAGFGFSHSQIGATFAHEISTDNLVAGVYSQFTTNDLNIEVNFQAGQMQFDSARLLANNTVASGSETASAKFDGVYIAPNIKVSKEVVTNEGFSLIPSIALGYTGIHVDGYSETGSTANATIASRTIHQIHGRAKLGLRYDWVSGNDTEYVFLPYAGFEGWAAYGDIDEVTGTIAGITSTFNPGGDKSVAAAFAGINVNAKISETARFESAIETKFDTASQVGISGNWGVKFKF